MDKARSAEKKAISSSGHKCNIISLVVLSEIVLQILLAEENILFISPKVREVMFWTFCYVRKNLESRLGTSCAVVVLQWQSREQEAVWRHMEALRHPAKEL